MASWVQVILAIGALIGSVGGLYALLTLPQQRRKITASTDQVVASTVEDLLGTARDQIGFLKTELLNARQDVVQVRVQANILEHRLQALVTMIHHPDMTMDKLRDMVPMADNNARKEGTRD